MPRPQTAPESFADMPFPVKGIDLSKGYGMQLPGTTPTGVNVRAYDALAARQRGGSRPGLVRYIPSQVSGAALIQELNYVVGVGFVVPGAP